MKKTFTIRVELEGKDEATIDQDAKTLVEIENYYCLSRNTINSTSVKGWELVKGPE